MYKEFFTTNSWVIQIFLIILVTASVHYFEAAFVKRLRPKLAKTKTLWDNALINAMHKPLGALIWFLGISYSTDLLHAKANGAAIFNAVPVIRELAVIALVVWMVIRFIREAEAVLIKQGTKNKTLDKTSINALSQILRAAVITTSILVALQTMGYKISGILALGGVGGIVLGFAAKDMLANFFGGLMIYFDRPFKVGDWVRSPDRQIEGTVEHIGWRLCRIRTFDMRPLYVPNSLFSTISVENPSRMLNRRIYTTVGVRYDDATKVRGIVTAVKEMLEQHPEIDTNKTLMVNLVEFGSSSLNFMIYTFTKTTEWIKFQAIQEDVFLKVLDIIDEFGAQCAFPTTTLHIPNEVKLQTEKLTETERDIAYSR